METKYIFITGGVLSSLGKGIASASIGVLLESMGLKVAMMKLDPYLNIDPGTMNPFEHGEVYVTDDGSETDLDLGHYYRFTDTPLSKLSNTTSGQIYSEVIRNERKGDYLGRDVQVVPHITDEIQRRIVECGKQEDDIDVCLVEIGGTVGDIESQPFLEAVRQFRYTHPQDTYAIHLTFMPKLSSTGELKTKPTQHSVQLLQKSGIFPDMILCRSQTPLHDSHKAKISLNCSVPRDAVFDIVDVENTIYEVPLNLEKESLSTVIARKLGLDITPRNLSQWRSMVSAMNSRTGQVRIGLVGKYLQLEDAYICIFESLLHGALASNVNLKIEKIDSETLTDMSQIPDGLDGILVPGGFGARGTEGKILAAKYCRENNVPYFGICLGMQLLCVEYARGVAGLDGANSTEFDPTTKHPVISLLSEQNEVINVGGTMRLGAYDCELDRESRAFEAYQSSHISERHRHRFEFNPAYRKMLVEAGLKFVGDNPLSGLTEVVEVKDHPWMVGVQFHPEFKSKPLAPHPLFAAFIKAALEYQRSRETSKKSSELTMV